MKIQTVLLTISVLLTTGIHAQSYEVTTSTGTYTNISNSTSLNGTAPWEDPEYLIPIGFDFQFFSTTINQIFINDYGFGAELTPGSQDTGVSPIMIPYTADIVDRGYDISNPDATTGSLSNISYVLEGNTGSRILKVEWNNVGFLSDIEADNISTDFTNFQLWLYEGSNEVEVRFGPNSITQPDLAFDGDTGASISLISEIDLTTEIISGIATTLSGNPMSPTVNNSNPYDNFFTGVIPNGMIYKFTPSTLSVVEPEFDTKVIYKPYPIPAKDFLYISGVTTPQEYTIFDVLGTTIAKGTIKINNKINIQNYPKGIYFVGLPENGLVKFVKK